MTSIPILESIRPESKQLFDEHIKLTKGFKPQKSIDTIPSKVVLLQQLIDIVNNKPTTMSEYVTELNDSLKICDEQIEHISLKKRDISDVLTLIENIGKTAQNTNIWIKFNAKNIGNIIDDIEYQPIGTEIKVNLATININNIIKLSDDIREFRLSTINDLGQKQIVCVKFNINTTDKIINGYGITRINC
jgi:hypothetical protein